MIELSKNVMETACRTGRQRCHHHDKGLPGQAHPEEAIKQTVAECFDAIFPKELRFVRPGKPAKKKRRSAEAVALGSTQRQAKHERAAVGYGPGLSRLLTSGGARGR